MPIWSEIRQKNKHISPNVFDILQKKYSPLVGEILDTEYHKPILCYVVNLNAQSKLKNKPDFLFIVGYDSVDASGYIEWEISYRSVRVDQYWNYVISPTIKAHKDYFPTKCANWSWVLLVRSPTWSPATSA